MKAYIRSAGIISPQPTYGCKGFPDVFRSDFSYRLFCIEPDYQSVINPVQLRRMPRILKMGLAASRICMSQSGYSDPDGIIVGTGLGCLKSLEKFLDEIYETNEQITSVLPFINSTHNAVAAQIAMLLKSNSYNVTYSHRSFSFESALEDTLLHIEEKKDVNILVGGIDELTEDFIKLHGCRGFWKYPVNTLELFSSPGKGTIAGEGAAFFLVSGNRGSGPAISIEGVHTFLTPEGSSEMIFAETGKFLESAGLRTDDIDLLIMGMNGDLEFDGIYHDLANDYFDKSSGIACYKHLCGDYYTSTGFALWAAKTILESQAIPPVMIFRGTGRKPLSKILIYNHLRNKEHSFIIVGRD
ncbi:MAG: hypothetical protein GYA41_07040 [Bacteroidales bacterium]|nr:hypothetical protein [Bacteroidales bacterium]